MISHFRWRSSILLRTHRIRGFSESSILKTRSALRSAFCNTWILFFFFTFSTTRSTSRQLMISVWRCDAQLKLSLYNVCEKKRSIPRRARASDNAARCVASERTVLFFPLFLATHGLQTHVVTTYLSLFHLRFSDEIHTSLHEFPNKYYSLYRSNND